MILITGNLNLSDVTAPWRASGSSGPSVVSVFAEGTIAVPQFGTVQVGPFAIPAGKRADVWTAWTPGGAGARAGWLNGGIQITWCWVDGIDGRYIEFGTDQPDITIDWALMLA
jgi:hypothetical protein